MRKSCGIKSYGILKLVLWCTLAVCAGAACMSLSSCGTAKEERGQTGQAQSLYAGKTQEADVFIEIPDLRQYGRLYLRNDMCADADELDRSIQQRPESGDI